MLRAGETENLAAKGRSPTVRRNLVLVFCLLFACATSKGNGEGSQGPQPELATPSAAPAAKPAEQVPKDVGRVVLMPPGRDPVVVFVEVVHRPADRNRGLMYRRTLAEDAGMLFLFEQERQQSFWMKNTYLPLDMVFIRADRSVLGVVENAEPLTESTRRVPGPSQFVLEVNAGFCRKHGIGAGTMVRFEDLAALQ